MGREYGKVMTSAWIDKDFTSLSRRAQGTYFFLASQPDLNRAGVLTMALNRWASRSAEKDRSLILADLAELAAKRFVVVDEGDEEVLVRSFVRNDEGWKSPNIMVAVAAAARQVASETLRSVIRDELVRIDTSGLSSKVNDKTGRSTREFIESVMEQCIRDLEDAEANPSVLAWGTLHQRSTEPLTEGFAEGFPEGSLTTTTPEPETTTTPEPETTPLALALPDASRTAKTRPPATRSDMFDDWYATYKRKEGRGDAVKAYAKALRTIDHDELTRLTVKWFEDRPTIERQFIPLPASWLNAQRWTDEPPPPTGTADSNDPRQPKSPWDTAPRIGGQHA